jgi:transcriptional regulator with XRE-family HTH domain
MAISSKQIRAARGLLNLSQKELAFKSGLSVNSLNNIERDVGSPRTDSLHAIRDALHREGVEFLERDGVRLAGEQLEIEKIEGPDILTHLYDEWVKAFPSGNGEVLIQGKDNDRLQHNDLKPLQSYKRFESFAIKNHIRERILFLQDDTHFLSTRNNYRWVPRHLFGEVPMAIYGNNVAIILWGPPVRMIVIRNPGIAETFRNQFEAIWSLGSPVPDEVHKFHYQKIQKILDEQKAALPAK